MFVVSTSLIVIIIRGLLSAAATGMIVAWVWLVFRTRSGEPVRLGRLVDISPFPPWGSATVLLAFLAYVMVNVGVIGLYQAKVERPGAAAPAIPRSESPQAAKPDRAPAPSESSTRHDQALPRLSNTEQMGMSAVVDLILIVLLPILVRLTSGARVRDLGASARYWRAQVGLGLIAGLITIPVVYLIQGLSVRIWTSNEHRLGTMLREECSQHSMSLALITAVVLAPAMEELLFRGLLQRWLIKLFARAVSASVAANAPEITIATPDALAGDESTEQPALVTWTSPAALGIVSTSLVFAAVHAPQWPAPIPLFVFSVALGVVFQRTGSLIAATIMHAMLNAISTFVMILLILMGG